MIKTLRTVGNSKAVILPSALVKKYKLDKVVIEETEEGIRALPAVTGFVLGRTAEADR